MSLVVWLHPGHGSNHTTSDVRPQLWTRYGGTAGYGCCLSIRRRILPDADFGIASVMTTLRICL